MIIRGYDLTAVSSWLIYTAKCYLGAKLRTLVVYCISTKSVLDSECVKLSVPN